MDHFLDVFMDVVLELLYLNTWDLTCYWGFVSRIKIRNIIIIIIIIIIRNLTLLFFCGVDWRSCCFVCALPDDAVMPFGVKDPTGDWWVGTGGLSGGVVGVNPCNKMPRIYHIIQSRIVETQLRIPELLPVIYDIYSTSWWFAANGGGFVREFLQNPQKIET